MVHRNSIIKIFFLILFIFSSISFIYAAINNNPVKITKVIQSFKAGDFLGAASTSIPVAVPPGRKNIQPDINIYYSSVSGNSWLGVGWNLDLGYIERSTKNNTIPKYDSKDTFCISFMGINSELETAESLPNEYYPKVTSFFIKILFKGSYWQAYDKEGRKYIFGQTADSRIDTGKGTFRWALNKVIDTCGNYMTITYSKYDYQIYPKIIEYTGNEATSKLPTHKIEFILEDRQDATSNYRSGYNIIINKRLKEINTYVSNSLANRYLLEYTYSNQTKRSLLNKFTEFGSDGNTSLPPMKFTYQDANLDSYHFSQVDPNIGNLSWNIAYDYFGCRSPNITFKDDVVYPADLRLYSSIYAPKEYALGRNAFDNKDLGKITIDNKGSVAINSCDYIIFHIWTYLYVNEAKTLVISAQGNPKMRYFLNSDYTNAHSFYTPVNLKAGYNLFEVTGYTKDQNFYFNLNYPLADNVVRMHSNQFILPQLSGDFNGDGLMDLATYSGRVKVALSKGDAFNPADYWAVVPGGGFPMYQDMDTLLLGDFNGDTLTDIMAVNSNTSCELVISTSVSFCDEGGGGRGFSPVKGTPFAADFNNDGITDLGLQAKTTNDILIGTIRRPHNINSTTYWLRNFPGKILIGDFNGDSLMDIASYDSSQYKINVALNKGCAFDNPIVWLYSFNIAYELLTCDFNNDGLTDIIYYDKPSNQIKVLYSDGFKFLAAVTGVTGFKFKDNDVILQSGDFNGDGGSDFYVFNPYSQKSEIAYSALNPIDTLTRLENGIGGTVSIKYDVSTRYDNNVTKTIQSQYEFRNYRVGSPGLPFSIPVVKEITISDGLGNSYSTNYSYKGGFYDREDREFRGFGYVNIADKEGNQKEIYFMQSDIYKGKPYKEDYRDPLGKLYLSIENKWYFQDMATNGFYPYPTVGSFVYLCQQNRLSYDGDETFKKSSTAYGYSSDVNQQCVKGDLIETSEWGDSTGAISKHLFYVRAKDENILSRPYSIYSSKSSYILSKKWLYYDNNTNPQAPPIKGLLTQEKVAIVANDFNPAGDLNRPNAQLTTLYSYDKYGNLASVTDPENHIATITYDSLYHIYPVENKNAAGHIVKNTYDPKTGQILNSTDANNQATTYIYDVLGRLTKVIGPNDTPQYPGIIYEYDLSFLPLRVTKRYKTAYPNIYATEYSFYDGLGRLIETKIQAEDDSTTGWQRQILKDIIVFDSQGKVKEKYNPYFVNNSNAYSLPDASIPKTTFEYDCLGRVIKVLNPDFTYRAIQYSDWTEIKTDENGHQSRLTYDAFNRLIKQEEFNKDGTYTTQYAYDLIEIDFDDYSWRKVFQITDNNKNITKVYYDLADRKVKLLDPDMGLWRYTWDKAGNLKKQTDAKTQAINFEYDALNRITRKTYPDGKFINYIYDDVNRPYSKGRLTSTIDLSGRTDYYYDNLGQEIKMTKAIDGVTYPFERTYNALGQMTSLKYPDGEVVRYTYNPQGIEKITGQQNYVPSLDYVATGQIAKINYGNGAYSDYLYDSTSLRLTDLKTNNGLLQNLHYQYDGVGNIKNITDYRNTATQDFIYDNLNRLIQAKGSYGTFIYQYDAIGNMTYKEGVNYSYAKGPMPHAVVSGSDGFTATYDANGNMISTNKALLSYNYENRLTKYEALSSDEIVTLEISLNPGWNFIAFPLAVDNNTILAVLSSITGKFDQLSRYNSTTGKFEHYIPDNPNYSQFTTIEIARGYQIYITAASGCTLRVTGKFPSKDYNFSLLKGWQIMGYLSKSKLRVVDAFTNLVKGKDYDRILRYDKATKTFIELNQTDFLEPGQSYFMRMLKNSTLAAFSKAEVTEFTYDANGRRVKKTINGNYATIYIDGLFEKTGSSFTKYIYLGQNRVCSVTINPSLTTYNYYHPDHLGSTSLITNSNGTRVQLTEYTPYGKIAINPQPQLTNYLFTGKELDSTGLYFYGSRYYDPKIGRFITADPIDYSDEGIKAAGGKDLKTFLKNPQNLNRYSYCLNNPMNAIDPDGLLTIFIPGTFSDWRTFFPVNYMKTVTNTFKDYNYYAFRWSGGDTNTTRMYAALTLAFIINQYSFTSNEKLNIIGYSHGGNIAFLASQLKLKHRIDNIVSLGTPIKDYKPNMDNVGMVYNVYSDADRVQPWGGNRFSSFNNEFGPAGRILKYINRVRNIHIQGYAHYELPTIYAWREIEEYIQNRD